MLAWLPTGISIMAFAFPSLLSTPRFRSFRGIGYVLLGLLLLILAAPFIVAKTPISSWLIAQVTRSWPVNVTVGSLSLGWFTSLEAENVVVVGPPGVDRLGEFAGPIGLYATRHQPQR